jgi:riboflavin synthase
MFTGLIEEVGCIRTIETTPGGSRITINAETILEGAKLGDSIAVDGACMTVVALEPNSFSFEVSPESLSKTNFGTFKPGTRVNLERPLTPTSRIGGHYVTGHVDGQATVLSIEPEGNSFIYTFQVDSPELGELLVPKGSVAILGISLTVNTVTCNRFSVAIIPHTLAHTNLGDYQAGDRVNIETDLLGKYARRLLFERASQQAPAEAPVYSGELDCGATINEAALVPAMNAVTLTHAKPTANIRTGGWFNFEAD